MVALVLCWPFQNITLSGHAPYGLYEGHRAQEIVPCLIVKIIFLFYVFIKIFLNFKYIWSYFFLPQVLPDPPISTHPTLSSLSKEQTRIQYNHFFLTTAIIAILEVMISHNFFPLCQPSEVNYQVWPPPSPTTPIWQAQALISLFILLDLSIVLKTIRFSSLDAFFLFFIPPCFLLSTSSHDTLLKFLTACSLDKC